MISNFNFSLSSPSNSKVPFVNCSFKILIICMIFLGEVNQFLYYFKIIFAGGVGKNGSTVAVSAPFKFFVHFVFISSVVLFLSLCFTIR